MKVCTDACILGAWLSARLQQPATILDIGSGTGLLMMMLAQRSPATIHGIEIDAAAYEQATANIHRHSWKERLTVFNGDARTFSFPQPYDFIITNPPFFENDWQAADEREQVAKHSTLLSLQELMTVINNNLQPNGSFGILLPFHRWEYFNQLATQHQFYITEKLFVKQSPRHNYFRAVLQYSRHNPGTAPATDLVIQKEDGAYTEEFITLLKDYYLYL
jgi:tRNA1Val (adenine37-N6)-methyltransferase